MHQLSQGLRSEIGVAHQLSKAEGRMEAHHLRIIKFVFICVHLWPLAP